MVASASDYYSKMTNSPCPTLLIRMTLVALPPPTLRIRGDSAGQNSLRLSVLVVPGVKRKIGD